MRRSFRIIFSALVLFLGWWLIRLVVVDDLDDMQATYAYTQANLLPAAQLVEINSGATWRRVTESTWIEAGTQVRTNETGTAQVVFADESVLMIEPNTTITLEQHTVTSEVSTIKIFQEVGRTWSQVEKLLSPKSSYEVETQTTLATVRGTAFGVSVDQSQTVDYLVAEGQVEAKVVKRVGEKLEVLAQTMVKPDQTLRWQPVAAQPGLEGQGFAMINLVAESVESNQNMKTWRDGTKQKIEELAPVMEQVKQEIKEERQAQIEELKRQQGLIKRLRDGLRQKLGLDQQLNQTKKPSDELAPPRTNGDDSSPLPVSPLPVSPLPEVQGDQVELLDQAVVSFPSPAPSPSETNLRLLDQQFKLIQ